MAYLTVRKGRRVVNEVPLRGDVITIGRGRLGDRDQPDVMLSDCPLTVSRYHAAIIRSLSGPFFIRDLGSANGTRLNGQRLYRQHLTDGDVISIDKFRVVFHSSECPSSNALVRVVDDIRSPLGRSQDSTTVPDIHPSMLSDGLPDHLRLLVNDLVQRALVLADHPGFFEELLELAARSAGAERGLIASATAQGVITALATYCDEPREDEGFLLERRTISAAIEDQSPRQSLLPSGKATLYLPVKLSPEISHVLYLESAAGRIFHQRDVDILGAFFTVLANVLTSPSTDNLIRTRDVGAQSFRWGTRLVGNGRQMRELRRQVLTWALREEDILLLGETGTGKSRVAEAVHEVSRRRNGPFCVVELPALGPHVIESELFGHVKGSFTGASAAHTGAFEAAHGGTLFLDEIGDISLEIQGKLRRAIERKEITRIGSVDPIRVDVRVITATNRDLLADVERGTFRRDLYERLGPTIRLPSLRGRKGDILLLLHYCLDECGGPVQAVAHSVVQGLLDYNWPGNVRELQRVVTEMTARTRGMVFTWDLPEMPPDDWMGGDTQDQQDHVPSLRNIEKQAIRETLKSCGWNKTRAARALGISRQTLHTKIRAYDLVIPAYDKWAN